MSEPRIRAANEAGSAVLVLSPSMDRLIWANTAGARLLPLGRGSALPAALPLVRQIRSAGRQIAAGKTVRVFLRPPAGSLLSAEMEPFTQADGTPSTLLIAEPMAGAETDTTARARHLLKEAELKETAAAIVSAGMGVVVLGSMLGAEAAARLLPPANAFLLGGEDRLVLDSLAERLTLARVASDLAVVRVEVLEVVDEEVPFPFADDEYQASFPFEEEGEPDGSSVEPEPEPVVRLRHNGAHPANPARVPASSAAVDATGSGDDVPADIAPPFPSGFVARFEREPVRFIWQIDGSGRFRSLSPEFAAAVGPTAANVIGRGFAEIALAFDFDADGAIGRLLERRNTWSGRTITWPVENTQRLVPVDLAALPMFGRDRQFEGFRGFGIVRMNESAADPARRGERLANVLAPAPETAAGEIAVDPPGNDIGASAPQLSDAGETATGVGGERATFGRRVRTPDGGSASSQVVSIDQRRRSRDGVLSETEEAAFRAIGAELAPAAGEDALMADASPDEGLQQDEASSRHRAGESPFADVAPEGGVAVALSALPLPVLVQVRDQLVFANREFLLFTGFEDLASLTERGGLDALFAEGGEPLNDGEVRIRRADNSLVQALAHLGRVSLGGRSALMISFLPASAVKAPEDQTGSLADDLRARATEIEDLRSALDVATDGVVLLDNAGRVARMNGAAEALFGTTSEACFGAEFASLLAPESRAPARDYLDALREGGLAGVLNHGREVAARVDGGTIPLFVSLGRLSDGRGWCAVIRDIAQWKRIEADLVAARRQAEEASLVKTRFLANIGHELRTPLNAIVGFADVIASECFGPVGHPRYLEYLGDIRRSGHHVLDLVNDLLDISKIEAGKAELLFESVSLNEVVAEVVSLMQPQANRERVIVRSNLPSDVPPVAADRRSLRQIALNLVANAIRFTPAGGQIIASTAQRKDGSVTLRFRDSGIGMTEAEIEIALSPFRQINPGLEDRGEGTGLGLPLTKAMAEANRAEFKIDSTPGDGTLVEIVFPASRVLTG